jgi:hypothetical protein
LYIKRNRTSFVIAIGQWSLSYNARGGKPATVESFHNGISNMVRNEKLYNIGNGNVKIYLQHLHHNPLGRYMNGCTDGKPRDWRSYTAFDAYNTALKEIVDEM